MKLINKAALVAEIEKKKIPFKKDIDDGVYPTYLCALMDFEDLLNTLETKEVDLELVTYWFEHIAQIADDRKTLTGEVMEDSYALDEIKSIAKNSVYYIEHHAHTKEVHYKPLDEDLERDAVSFCFDNGLNTTPHIAKTIAKHYYELGLKNARKENNYDA